MLSDSFLQVVLYFCIGIGLCVFIKPLYQLLQLKPEEVLIESTGVIGQRIKKVNMVVYCDLVH